MFNDPAVLYLSFAVVLTDDTVNGNGVANNRLGFELVVTICAVCAVSAVDGEDIAVFIGNSHVTVGSVVNFGDNAGYIVLAFGISVVFLRLTESDCIRDGELAVCFGNVRSGFALGNVEFNGSFGSAPRIFGIVGSYAYLDLVAFRYFDSIGGNNGIAVRPLGVAVNTCGEVVYSVGPVAFGHGDGESAVYGSGVYIVYCAAIGNNSFGYVCNDIAELFKNDGVAHSTENNFGNGGIKLNCFCAFVNYGNNVTLCESGCIAEHAEFKCFAVYENGYSFIIKIEVCAVFKRNGIADCGVSGNAERAVNSGVVSGKIAAVNFVEFGLCYNGYVVYFDFVDENKGAVQSKVEFYITSADIFKIKGDPRNGALGSNFIILGFYFGKGFVVFRNAKYYSSRIGNTGSAAKESVNANTGKIDNFFKIDNNGTDMIGCVDNGSISSVAVESEPIGIVISKTAQCNTVSKLCVVRSTLAASGESVSLIKSYINGSIGINIFFCGCICGCSAIFNIKAGELNVITNRNGAEYCLCVCAGAFSSRDPSDPSKAAFGNSYRLAFANRAADHFGYFVNAFKTVYRSKSNVIPPRESGVSVNIAIGKDIRLICINIIYYVKCGNNGAVNNSFGNRNFCERAEFPEYLAVCRAVAENAGRSAYFKSSSYILSLASCKFANSRNGAGSAECYFCFCDVKQANLSPAFAVCRYFNEDLSFGIADHNVCAVIEIECESVDSLNFAKVVANYYVHSLGGALSVADKSNLSSANVVPTSCKSGYAVGEHSILVYVNFNYVFLSSFFCRNYERRKQRKYHTHYEYK